MVSNEDSGTASVVDVRTGRVAAALPAGREPEGVAWRPTATVDVGEQGQPVARPMGLALFPGNGRLYVTTGRGGGAAVLDTRARRLIATIRDTRPLRAARRERRA